MVVYGRERVWPVSRILPWLRRVEMVWNDWSLLTTSRKDVLEDYRTVCDSLQKFLGERESFFESG